MSRPDDFPAELIDAPPGLRIAYRQRQRQLGEELAFVWFLVRRWELQAFPQLFAMLQHASRESGLATCLSFVRREIEVRDLAANLRAGVNAAYGVALKNAGVIPNASDPGYVLATKEVTLEAVKALLPVRGLAGEGELCHEDVAIAMSVPWLHFLEVAHQQLGLPRVRAMRRWMERGSPWEEEILQSDDFTRFKLTAEERPYYRELVGDATAAVALS